MRSAIDFINKEYIRKVGESNSPRHLSYISLSRDLYNALKQEVKILPANVQQMYTQSMQYGAIRAVPNAPPGWAVIEWQFSAVGETPVVDDVRDVDFN